MENSDSAGHAYVGNPVTLDFSNAGVQIKHKHPDIEITFAIDHDSLASASFFGKCISEHVLEGSFTGYRFNNIHLVFIRQQEYGEYPY